MVSGMGWVELYFLDESLYILRFKIFTYCSDVCEVPNSTDSANILCKSVLMEITKGKNTMLCSADTVVIIYYHSEAFIFK